MNRYRYRRRGWGSYRRSRYSRGKSTIVKRARGNAKAANNQADTTDVIVNLMHKNMCMTNAIYTLPTLDITPDVDFLTNKIDCGTCAINIFDLLAKSDFFNCYAPMYDQFRINSIKVKITPTKWATFNQEYTTNNIESFVSTGVGENDHTPISDLPHSANYLTYKSLSNKYQYPQSLTIVTAWDRTGLSSSQFNKLSEFIDWNKLSAEEKTLIINQIWGTLTNDRGDQYNQGFSNIGTPLQDLYFTNIGDRISTYSSAQTKQLIAGQSFNCTRYLYPQNQQEKSLYYSTNSLLQDFIKMPTSIAYKKSDSYVGPERLTNLFEDPSIPFKPTLLIGVLGSTELSADKQTVEVPNPDFNPNAEVNENNPRTIQQEDCPVYYNKIRPIHFNCEFDIGVTFRGLRKTQVV